MEMSVGGRHEPLSGGEIAHDASEVSLEPFCGLRIDSSPTVERAPPGSHVGSLQRVLLLLLGLVLSLPDSLKIEYWTMVKNSIG